MSAHPHPAFSGQLDSLLENRPQQPYAFYRSLLPEEALRRFSRRRAFELLERPEANSILRRRDGEVVGLACWSSLAWDTHQMNMAAGRLDLLLHRGAYAEARAGKAALLEELLEACRRHGVRHLTARVDAGDLSSLHALEAAGFEIIDGIQTFSLRLRPTPWAGPDNGLEVRAYRPSDLDQVLAIARTAYVHDRFHADPALGSETADALNEEWVRNCCLGTASDGVIVAAEGARVLGYVTCKVDRRSAEELAMCFGSIVLVATAAPARGRGMARQATLGALEWFRGQGVDIVEVGTQLSNIPAARLYESCGFRLAAVTLTLRKLL
jgi:GNAT superfamily N-acetyltransferase